MYYIYLHIRPDTNQPFYVGKGNGKRAQSKQSRSNYWHNIVNKHGYQIVIIENGLTHEEAALREVFWINHYGRKDLQQGILINLTNGGEGCPGRNVSEKMRIAVGLSNMNRPKSLIQKMVVAGRYKGKTGSNHNRSKKVRCIETGLIFGSQSEAQRILGLSNGSVCWSIKNKKPIFGMHFEIAA